MQSKLSSVIETACNVGSGFLIAWFIAVQVFPLFGVVLSPAKGFWITAVMTVVSVIRSYTWRRYFNGRIKRRLKMFDDYADVQIQGLVFKRETDKAILVMTAELEDVWLPKSQIKYSPGYPKEGDVLEAEMPEWLAEEKGLE